MANARAMRRVLILGATSAIAAEVAAVYDRYGDRIHLVARNAEKLDDLARRIDVTRVTTTLADFAKLDRCDGVVASAIEALGGLDTALIAHGDLGDQVATERSFASAEAVFRTNLVSVVSLLIPLANHMEKARSGRLGVITSVAGDRGRPRNYTYGAAKGALNVYLQGLRTRLRAAGVSVTTIKLGPVDTPMTRDHKKNIFFAKPAPVARDIVRALERGQGEVYIPSIWRAIMPLVRNTPEELFRRLSFLSGR